ncbi:unnamed protein product [Spirodela intermedia]|uniref:Uncharacterized protein n=1 Tax=Spirodela intermedia TaxID=51605 RepID=A0A7I8LIE9_SPIIN|nr:unnamed protein product [Spirodela intermedia]
MSTLESHSCPLGDHEIRHLQKFSYVESSSYTHYMSRSTKNKSVLDYAEEFYYLSSQINLTKSELYMILRFKVALQLFSKLNDIVMVVEHVEELLQKGKTKI